MRRTFKIVRIVLAVAVAGGIFFAVPRITFDDTLQNWIPPENTKIREYEAFLQDFKTDALLIITFDDSVQKHRRLSPQERDAVLAEIRRLPFVERVIRWPTPFLRTKVKPGKHIHSYLVSYVPPSSLNPNRPQLIQQIKERLQATGAKYHLAGTGVIHKALNEETRQATWKFLGIGLAVLFVLLFLLTRNTLIVLKTIGISLGGLSIAILGAYVWHIPINLAMSVLPILILFYSSSITVHILNHQGNFRAVFWPTCIAVLTTCAGFSTFLLESVPLLRHFALLAISGLLGGFLWAILFFGNGRTLRYNPLMLKEKMVLLEKAWKPAPLLVAVVIGGILIPLALRVRAEINPLSLLPRRHPAIQDYYFIEQKVSPYVPIEYRVNLKTVRHSEVRRWIDAVFHMEEVGAVWSYLSVPVWVNPRNIGVISRDGTTGRITFFVPLMSTSEGVVLVEKMERMAHRMMTTPEALSTPTGFVALYVTVADNLAKSFTETLILAFLLVFAIILLFLRNLRLFIAAIFPNVLPVLAVLGVMGGYHIPLDMVTLPIGCLVLGIIVDDTVHFLYWFRKRETLHGALQEAGPGMIMTSIVHILGFSVFLLAAAPPIRYFGMLSITAMVTALFGDVIILPVILKFALKNHLKQGVV